MASRKATSRIAETLAAHESDAAVQTSLPPPARLSRFSSTLLFAISSIRRRPLPPVSTRWPRRRHRPSGAGPRSRRGDLGVRGPHGFRSPEGNEALGSRTGSRPCVPSTRKKLAAHRARIEEAVHRIGWSFLVHHTDRPASEPLLTLMMRLQGMAGDYRWKPQAAAAGRHAMTLGPIAFLAPWLLAGLLALPSSGGSCAPFRRAPGA